VTLVLDTASVPVDDRGDALCAAMTSAVVPSRVDVVGRGDQVGARIQAWQLGASSSLVHVVASGHRVTQ
jgi:hypothetical protein